MIRVVCRKDPSDITPQRVPQNASGVMSGLTAQIRSCKSAIWSISDTLIYNNNTNMQMIVFFQPGCLSIWQATSFR